MRSFRKGKPALLRKAAKPFTGSCPVREHTADGAYVGRCYFATYAGECPRHGDVARFLGEEADLADADDRKL